jgi:hypothetical protein
MDHDEERRKNIAEWEMFQTGEMGTGNRDLSINNAPNR